MTEIENDPDEDLLAVLRTIAERAGKEILAYYVEAEEIEVRQKEDASPVTEADEAAEAFILEALAKLTPQIPVVAEELAAAGKLPDNVDPAGDFWLVDPLDGTKEFLKRNGEFTVNIALIHGGEPIAGVVHAPALAMTWAGTRVGHPKNAREGHEHAHCVRVKLAAEDARGVQKYIIDFGSPGEANRWIAALSMLAQGDQFGRT